MDFSYLDSKSIKQNIELNLQIQQHAEFINKKSFIQSGIAIARRY